MTVLEIYALAAVAVAIMTFFVRIERRLTRIETDISWLKDNHPTCQPPLDKNTQ